MPGARVLVVVGVAAALIAGCLVWMSRPRPEPVPATEVRSSPAGPATAPSPRASVIVHVAGKVRHPGVVTLPGGARVIDAIKAAGGPRRGAGTGALNLARPVVDGEQILVGVRGAPAPAAPVAPGGAGGSAPGGAPGMRVDLNTATTEQLDQLPGVGPVLAQRIVDYRNQHGGYRSVDQLQEVTGIGESKFADIKDLVRV
jgi:competence protein ComEA